MPSGEVSSSVTAPLLPSPNLVEGINMVIWDNQSCEFLMFVLIAFIKFSHICPQRGILLLGMTFIEKDIIPVIGYLVDTMRVVVNNLESVISPISHLLSLCIIYPTLTLPAKEGVRD